NGSATIGANSTLQLGGTANGSITFGSGNGTLKIDGTTMPTSVISGFAPGDKIDLTNAPFSPLGIATLVSGTSGTTLVITEGTQQYSLNVDASPLKGQSFQLSSDGSGGTIVQLMPGVAGFDIGNFPGLQVMEQLIENTNLSVTGFYLSAPNHVSP